MDTPVGHLVPHGWYHLCDVADIAEDTPLRVDAFGADLIAWRGADGTPVVTGAHCPHLGAHLGWGGEVRDGCLTCPFHGWQFDTDGNCTHIPYSTRRNRRGVLDVWLSDTRGGRLFVWYHPQRQPPRWPLIRLDDLTAGLNGPVTSTATIDAPIQELAENTVDSAHFQQVHHTAGPAVIDRFDTTGPHATMVSRQAYRVADGSVDGHINAELWGPGLSVVQFTGILDAVNIACATPIDARRTRLRFEMWSHPDAHPRFADAFCAEIRSQIDADRPIWEHKIHLERPALCVGDGPIGRFRRWYHQFYDTDLPAPAPEHDLTSGT